MPSYAELQKRLAKGDLDLFEALRAALGDVAKLRERHVVFYASGFLQNLEREHETMISREDVNGFMSALYRAQSESLTLILHTSGGELSAVESIVEYLHSKFDDIEVIVPAYAMSGGAMISLASDHLIMGRVAQLGPIHSQMPWGSAWTIEKGYEKAEADICRNPKMAALWVPLMRDMGAFLPIEAKNALFYGHDLVSGWLKSRSLINGEEEAHQVAAYFNAAPRNEHGEVLLHNQRIGLKKLCDDMKLNVDALEDSQELQDAVMTAYWLLTIFFEQSDAAKVIASSENPPWIKALPIMEKEEDDEEDSEEE